MNSQDHFLYIGQLFLQIARKKEIPSISRKSEEVFSGGIGRQVESGHPLLT